MNLSNSIKIIFSLALIVYSSYGCAQICIGPLSIQLDGSNTGDSLDVLGNSQNVTCASDANGALTLLVDGGSPSYSYVWSDAGNLDSIRFELEQGIYMVTVTDSEGCSQMLSFSIDELNASNSDLIMQNGCGTCWLDNGESSFFFDENNDYIAVVSDNAPDLFDLQDTEVCAFFDNTVSFCNDHPYLQRQWSVHPVQNESACIKLFFTQDELENLAAAIPNETTSFQDLIDNDRICVTAMVGGDETCDDYTSQTIYSTADSPPLVLTQEDPTNGIWSVEVCTNEFATFYVHVCDLKLPVELIYFNGEKEGATNVLSWETAAELNTSHFNLEKSTDGENFDYTDKILAIGQSSANMNYNYRDLNVSGRDYYRLKIVDFDGHTEYSNTIVIDREQVSTSNIYPNLFDNFVYYDTHLTINDNLSFTVFDAIGQVAHQQKFQLKAGRQLLSLNLARLPEGNYYIHIQSGDGTMETFKLVKN